MAGRMRRRVILGLLGLVALVVVASVVLPPHWLAPRHPESLPAGPPPSGTWNQTHWIDLPPGWRVVARNVSRTQESTSLDGPDGNGCLVIVFPGEVDRRLRPVRTERVQVGGIEGSTARSTPTRSD